MLYKNNAGSLITSLDARVASHNPIFTLICVHSLFEWLSEGLQQEGHKFSKET
jgi:hypothetical protein